MTRDELLDRIAQRLAGASSDRPLRVAVNGPVAVGKSMFTGDLCDRVRALGRPVVNTSFDRFRLADDANAPEEIGERLYSHVLDFELFRDRFLLPLGPDGDRRYLQDATEEQTAPRNAIGIADGVLLFHPVLNEHWDLRIYLDCSPTCAIERAAIRNERYPQIPDAEAARENYRTRFLPFLALYEKRVSPRSKADILVNYEDFDAPRILT